MEQSHELAGNVLAGLQEIPLPAPVTYLPQTAGWLIVGIVLLLALLFATWRIIRHRRANAYRRQALAELTRIEDAMRHTAPTAVSLQSLPELLKRTAIAAGSRAEVASLSGDEWLRFLDRSLGENAFMTGPGHLLTRIAYCPASSAEVDGEQLQSLLSLARRWIRHHHADV